MNTSFTACALVLLFFTCFAWPSVAQQASQLVPLDPKIYDSYLGAYRLANGELIVVGRTSRRLYFHEPRSGAFRGLDPISETTWVAGPSLLIYSPVERQLTFLKDKSGATTRILLKEGSSEREARKAKFYKEERVSFNNGDISLAGTLLTPNRRGPHPGVVLVHGSGPQDRNGYVSYIRVIADHFARHGVAALIYDKRGVGASTGDWASASFSALAEDALAGLRFLKSRREINHKQIGLGGSSQAGWVIAKAIGQSKEVAFVITISAGGSAYTAARQNLYNSETEMRAAGISEEEIRNTLTALNLLYDYVRTGDGAERYDAAVNRAGPNPKLENWLTPPSSQIDRSKRNYWFTALEIDFDPVPAWAQFEGPVLAVFGELDTSTPTREVVPILEKALAGRKNKDYTIKVFPKAHHLILEASTGSDEELPRLKKFVPGFFDTMSDWLRKRTGVRN